MATVELAESPQGDRVSWDPGQALTIDGIVVIKGDSRDGARSYPWRSKPGPFSLSFPYGIIDRGEGPFLLVYQARAAFDLSEAGSVPKNGLQLAADAGSDAWTVRVRWNGTPDASAKLFLSDGTPLVLGQNGTARVPFGLRGMPVALRALHVERKSGTWQGSRYGLKKTWSTLTLPVVRPMTLGSDEEAYRSLQTASEAREAVSSALRWSADFEAGDGHRTVSGRVVADRSPEPEIVFEDRDVRWPDEDHVRTQISSLFRHRRSVPFADGDGRNVVTWTGRKDRTGREIAVADTFGSTYRVKDGAVTEVARTIEGRRLVLRILDVERLPNGKTLSRRFTSTTTGPDGTVESELTYEDRFVTVGDDRLPAERKVTGRVRGKSVSMKVVFSDYKVLKG